MEKKKETQDWIGKGFLIVADDEEQTPVWAYIDENLVLSIHTIAGSILEENTQQLRSFEPYAWNPVENGVWRQAGSGEMIALTQYGETQLGPIPAAYDYDLENETELAAYVSEVDEWVTEAESALDKLSADGQKQWEQELLEYLTEKSEDDVPDAAETEAPEWSTIPWVVDLDQIVVFLKTP